MYEKKEGYFLSAVIGGFRNRCVGFSKELAREERHTSVANR